MKTAHISFSAIDSVMLPGLLYEPDHSTTTVVIWLHGMGDSGVFYSPRRITALAEQLTERGIALLAFNNRGAHNSKLLRKVLSDVPEITEPFQAGTYYELIADCAHDIDGATAFLKQRGFSMFYLAGHSTGANKICAYHARRGKSVFSKFVLAGPGDDVGLNFMQLGSKKFQAALINSEAAIKAGKPLKIMPQYSGMYPFSAQSTYDVLNPDGDYNTFPFYEATHAPLGHKQLFAEYSAIRLPMLIIAGSEDGATATAGGASQALQLLMNNTHPEARKTSSFQLIEGSDHSFTNHEDVFSERVASWLAQ